METLSERARAFAVLAHRRIDQRRKYTGDPYEVHLARVAAIVASAGGDEEMVAAAWLHDTIEDTEATFEDVQVAFGPGVASLVLELTDVSRPADGNRAARKAMDLRHTAASSPRAKTVKLADILDNLDDICRHDPGFGRVFLEEARSLLAVLGEGDPVLHGRLARSVEEWSRRLAAAAGSRAGRNTPVA